MILVATATGLHTLADVASVELADHDVVAVAPAAGTVWAITDGTTVVSRGEDGWASRASVRVLRLTCLAVDAGSVVVGTSEAHLLRLTGGRLAPVEGFERAEGREGWYTPWGGPPDTRSIAVQPDGTWLVNVHVGGVLRAGQLDGAWQATLDPDLDVHQIAVAAPDRLLAACAMGLAQSDDGGRSWSLRTDGLTGRYARAVAVAGDTVLVAASRGPGGGDAAVYRAPLDGGPFRRCEEGVPAGLAGNIDTGWLAALGERVAVATPDGEVYTSDDAGREWTLVATGLPAPRWVAITGG